MATRQYENFRNPVINGRQQMAQLNAQRLSNQAAAQKNFVTDPWFQLGSSIGQAMADNYNARGISKGMDEMRGVLGQVGQVQPQAEQPTTMQLDNQNSIGVLDQAGEMANGMMPNPGASINDVMKQEKRDYRIGKYIDSDNPDGEAIQSKNDIKAMDQAGNNMDFTNVNKEDVREQVRQQLEANGRTPYQVEQVLGQFDRMYDAKYGKWADTKATDLISKGQKAIEDGDMAQAYNWYMAAAKYSPEQAKLGLNYLQFANNQRQQRDKEFMAGYKRDEKGNLVINPDHPTWSQRKYGGVGGGSRGGSSVAVGGNTPNYGAGRWIGRRDAVSNEEFDNAMSVLGRYKDYSENDPAILSRIKAAEDTVDRYQSANHGAVRGWNIDSEEDVINYLRGAAYENARNPNMSGTDILERIRTSGIMSSPYWRDELLDIAGITSYDN